MNKGERRKKTVRWQDLETPKVVGVQETHWENTREEAVERRQRVKSLTFNQGKYLKAIETSTVTICTGPAGTGKTYMACGLAAGMLLDNRIRKIVITRPIVACGKGYGFRPGTMEEKVLPVMRPMIEALEDFLGKREVAKLMKDQVIEMWPLDDMRGANIRDCFIICDEAQNAEYEQLHMLLTRFAKGSRVVVCGDASQTDLRNNDANPLLTIIYRFTPNCHSDITVVRLFHEDIVRHPLIQWIDERLSQAVSVPTAIAKVGDSWYFTACPACRANLWMADTDDERVQCWSCRKILSVPQGDTTSVSCDQSTQANESFSQIQ